MDALAGFPFTITRPASQASLATVLRLIRRDTFKNLSNLILFLLITEKRASNDALPHIPPELVQGIL